MYYWTISLNLGRKDYFPLSVVINNTVVNIFMHEVLPRFHFASLG